METLQEYYDTHKQFGYFKHANLAIYYQGMSIANSIGERRRAYPRVENAVELQIDALKVQLAEIALVIGEAYRDSGKAAKSAPNDVNQRSFASVTSHLSSTSPACTYW